MLRGASFIAEHSRYGKHGLGYGLGIHDRRLSGWLGVVAFGHDWGLEFSLVLSTPLRSL